MRIIFYLLSFLFISCSSYKVKTYYDEFEYFEWFRFENNKISEDYIGLDIEINPQKWIQGESIVYSIQVILMGEEELNIEHGFSILFSLDNKRIDLNKDEKKSFRQRKSKNIFYEEAWFEIDKETLYKLAFSNDAMFKIIGDSEFIKGEFSEFNKSTFKDFYIAYVDDSVMRNAIGENEKSKFNINLPLSNKPETTLSNFTKLLLENGWNGNVNEFDWDYHLDNISYIQKLDIDFDFPIGLDNYYYPKFQIFEILYEDQNKVPFVTKNEFQNYPCSKCPNAFPIIEFNFLFPEYSENEINNIENWSVFRKNGDVYLVIGEENKVQVDEVFGYVVEYFQSETNSDLKIIKDRIQNDYKENKNRFEAERIVQEFLKENGYYLGEIDGLFGNESRKSLQKFLKSKEFYYGEINGNKNLELSNSIKEYQEFLEVEQTGWLNLELAEEMLK